jgi:hypothetical protein
MDNKEVEKVLEELQEVRPEKLTGKAKRLFEAIMTIADGRDKAESDLYEANNRIVDYMDIIEERDRIIDLMANEIYIEHNPHFNTVEDVKEYFEERCKDAKD